MQKQDKILITGASGLIGSALVRLLKAGGYENVLTPTHSELDLCSQMETQNYFKENTPKFVFHLAAKVGGIKENQESPAVFIGINTIMHCNVFHCCLAYDVKKLLFPGSACAYPRDAEQPIKESSFLQGIPEPTNLAYAVAKINGIVMAQSYAKQYGKKVVLPMVTNTYGIGDRSNHVIPDLIKKAGNLNCIGSNLREFIYADDVADAFLFLMQNYDSSEIINVGTIEEISILNLAYKISKTMGHELVYSDCASDIGAKRKCLDSSKLYAMGWKPKVNLDEGIRRVVASL